MMLHMTNFYITKKWGDMNVKSLAAVSSRTVMLCLTLCLFAVPGCTSEQVKSKAPQQSSGDAVSDTNLLATIADSDKPLRIISHGTEHVGEQASYKATFSESGTDVAYVASVGRKFQVVHNQSRSKEYAAVGQIVFTSDGRRIVYPALSADGKWRMVLDGNEGRPYDTLLTPRFSPDGKHVVYQAKNGDKWFIVVDNTPNEGTIASYTEPEFSSDATRIAFVEAAASNDKMRLIVSDLSFKKHMEIWSIGDLLSTTSKSKTRIAAAQVVGKKFRIIDFNFATPDVVHEGRLYDQIEKLTMSDDGNSLAYCVLKGQKRLVVLDGREEPLPDGVLREQPVIRPDKKGVGILFVTINQRFFLHQSFINRNKKGKMYDEAYNLSYSKNGSYVYEARRGSSWFVVVNGAEGPAFDRVISPLFSPDGTRIAYHAKKGGKRFVVIADVAGKTVSQHPSYDHVFDVRFSADGKSVAYGVKDAKRLVWKIVPL